MRFGKRAKSPLFWGRQTRDTLESEEPEVEEGDGSEMDSFDAQPGPEDAAPEAPSTYGAGDPTQRLLTALGRFQRQIARARDGAPQEAWSDECMRQLISATEIAVEQGWRDVVETLTETARILQSYEDAGRAPECVKFLSDSYEILCLMVGDLIVGKVRSGVVAKWNERHAAALDEMGAQGIALADDRGGEAPEEPAPATSAEPADTLAPLDQVSPADGPGSPEPEPAAGEDAFAYEPGATAGPEDPSATASAADGWRIEPEEAEEPAAVPEWDLDAVIESDDPFPTAVEESESAPDEPDPTLQAEVGARWEAFLQQAEDDLTPDAEAERPGEEAPEPPAAEPQEAPEPPAAEPAPGFEPESEPEEPAAEAPEVPAPDAGPDAPAAADVPEPVAEDPSLPQAEADDSAPAAQAGASLSGRSHLTGQVASTLDDVCEHLAQLAEIEESDEAGRTRHIGAIADGIGTLEEHAREHDLEGAVLPCLAMNRLVRLLREQEGPPDTRFFEVAYGFCDLYAEAGQGANVPGIQQWLADCDDLLVEWAAKERAAKPDVEAVRESNAEVMAQLEQLQPLAPLADAPGGASHASPEPSAPDQPASESGLGMEPPALEEVLSVMDAKPQAGAPEKPAPPPSQEGAQMANLLETAQRALLDGNVANAKLLALQAAAQFAEQQAQEAEKVVERAEQRLREGATEAEKARKAVAEAESAVENAEESVSTSERDLMGARATVRDVAKELDHGQALIQEIDQQIAALQAQRADAVEKRDGTQQRLSEAQADEGQKEKSLEERKGDEMSARVTLEDTRQRVKDLERRRAEDETRMERAREVLMRQRESLADIEKTISQVCNSDSGTRDDGESLF